MFFVQTWKKNINQSFLDFANNKNVRRNYEERQRASFPHSLNLSMGCALDDLAFPLLHLSFDNIPRYHLLAEQTMMYKVNL